MSENLQEQKKDETAEDFKSKIKSELKEELKKELREELTKELNLESKEKTQESTVSNFNFIKTKQFKIGVILFLCLIFIGEIGAICACLSTVHRHNYINYDRHYYIEPKEYRHSNTYYEIIPLQNQSDSLNSTFSTSQILSSGAISK